MERCEYAHLAPFIELATNARGALQYTPSVAAHALLTELYLPSEVPRIHVSELNSLVFLREYVAYNRPVVILGALPLPVWSVASIVTLPKVQWRDGTP